MSVGVTIWGMDAECLLLVMVSDAHTTQTTPDPGDFNLTTIYHLAVRAISGFQLQPSQVADRVS